MNAPIRLMDATPTGHRTNVDRDCLRDEFKWDAAAETIDAPEFMPAGGCFSWASYSFAGRFYTQPLGQIRGQA